MSDVDVIINPDGTTIVDVVANPDELDLIEVIVPDGLSELIEVEVPGPVGPAGPTGPEGPEGPQGPAGPQGATSNEIAVQPDDPGPTFDIWYDTDAIPAQGLSGGVVGYAEVTEQQPIPDKVITDLTGLNTYVTINANRMYKITAQVAYHCPGGNVATIVRILVDFVLMGQSHEWIGGIGGYATGIITHHCTHVVQKNRFAPGLHYVSLQAYAMTANNVLYAIPVQPSFVLVEDIGSG